jgi:hypothetical protein
MAASNTPISKMRQPSPLLGLALALALAFPAYAADLIFEDDTIVEIGGHYYTVLAGSEATALDVGDATVTVTVPDGSTFTFQSPDRNMFNNNAGIAQTCTESDNRLVITGPQTDVVITPDPDTLCTVKEDDSEVEARPRQTPQFIPEARERYLEQARPAEPKPPTDRDALRQQLIETQLQLIALLEQLLQILQEELAQEQAEAVQQP